MSYQGNRGKQKDRQQPDNCASGLFQSLQSLQQQNGEGQNLLVLVPMMVPCATNFQQPTDFSRDLTATQMGTVNTEQNGDNNTDECEEKPDVEQCEAVDTIIDRLELQIIRNEIEKIIEGENFDEITKEDLYRLYEMALVNMKKDIASLMRKQQELFEQLFTLVNDK